MPVGIVASNVSPQSFLKLRREHILFPLAAVDDFFATTAANSIASAAAGTAVVLTAPGALSLTYARLPQVTATDALGSTLAVTVRLVGRRFGKRVQQDISTSGGTQTVNGTLCLDQLVSATIIAISGNAASDTLKIGFADSRVGLFNPIRSVKSVKLITKFAAGTPSAAQSGSTIQTSTIVKVADSSVDVKALFSNTAIAVTDQYLIEYLADGPDEFGTTGKYA